MPTKIISFDVVQKKTKPGLFVYDVKLKVDGLVLSVLDEKFTRKIVRMVYELYLNFLGGLIPTDDFGFILHLNQGSKNINFLKSILSKKYDMNKSNRSVHVSSFSWEIRKDVFEESTDVVLRVSRNEVDLWLSEYWFNWDECLLCLYVVDRSLLKRIPHLMSDSSNDRQKLSVSKNALLIIDNWTTGFHFRIFSKENILSVVNKTFGKTYNFSE